MRYEIKSARGFQGRKFTVHNLGIERVRTIGANFTNALDQAVEKIIYRREHPQADNSSASAKIPLPISRLWKLNFSREVCHSAKKIATKFSQMSLFPETK